MEKHYFMQEEILFKGNANRLNGFLGIYAQGGNLVLTPKLLRFSSSWKGKSYELSVDEIISVEKFGFNGLAVCLRDGRIERFRLRNRGALIEKLRNIKGNLSVTSMQMNSLSAILGAVGLLLWLASLFISWMVALPAPLIEVPISPLEQLYISFSTWGLLGFLGSNFSFICVIIVILLGIFTFASKDVYMVMLSGLAGTAISLIILVFIQGQSFSIERPAPLGSIEFLRFRPDVGLFLYLIAGIILFAAGYVGDKSAVGLSSS